MYRAVRGSVQLVVVVRLGASPYVYFSAIISAVCYSAYLPVCVSYYLFVYRSIRLSLSASFYLRIVSPFVCLSLRQLICMSVCQFVYLSSRMSLCPSARTSVGQSISLFMCLFAILPVTPSVRPSLCLYGLSIPLIVCPFVCPCVPSSVSLPACQTDYLTVYMSLSVYICLSFRKFARLSASPALCVFPLPVIC